MQEFSELKESTEAQPQPLPPRPTLRQRYRRHGDARGCQVAVTLASGVLRSQDAKRLGADAIAIYRKKHGLLSADDIRALRERFGLTPVDLARLLRLGGNTISRWEAGRNVQTGAMDMLLRLLRDLPGGIDYVRRHAA